MTNTDFLKAVVVAANLRAGFLDMQVIVEEEGSDLLKIRSMATDEDEEEAMESSVGATLSIHSQFVGTPKSNYTLLRLDIEHSTEPVFVSSHGWAVFALLYSPP